MAIKVISFRPKYGRFSTPSDEQEVEGEGKQEKAREGQALLEELEQKGFLEKYRYDIKFQEKFINALREKDSLNKFSESQKENFFYFTCYIFITEDNELGNYAKECILNHPFFNLQKKDRP